MDEMVRYCGSLEPQTNRTLNRTIYKEEREFLFKLKGLRFRIPQKHVPCARGECAQFLREKIVIAFSSRTYVLWAGLNRKHEYWRSSGTKVRFKR